ncbi:hypothetical protein ACIP4S_33070 [Streptomyces chartreusis]|uniref:hypothetical protein n=1 Tax=Streptomyces chartreusis TaxID=1969 RepID=UPI0037F61F54
MASWDLDQPLRVWMADQLRQTHPGLTSKIPSSIALAETAVNRRDDIATYLVNAGLILPMFDGFDELPPPQLATVLDKLNRLPATRHLVLVSRTDPYRMALKQPDSTVRLNGAAAIHLLPVDAQAAADYLQRDAGGRDAPAAHRWDAVVPQLGTMNPVGQALATPLGLFLLKLNA